MTRVEDWNGRLGRRLRLRDLHLLSTIVRWSSTAQAPKHLGMSQHGVSGAIAQVEDALRVRLLDRGPRGVEPTIYAEALLRRGVLVFNELKQGIREIESLADPHAGEVHVGCAEFLAAGFLPAIIDQFSRLSRQAQVVIQILDAPTGRYEYRELRDRHIDLMLARIPQPIDDPELDVNVLFEEQFFIVASTKSSWARRRSIMLAELVDEPWIMQTALVVRS